MKQLYLIFFLQCIFNSSIYAQEQLGSISGKVTDAETGEIIPFVNINVELEGKTIQSTFTDFDGFYYFDSIPIGTYRMHINSVGYQTNVIEGIEVKPDKNIELNSELNEEGDIEIIVIRHVTIPLINQAETRTGVIITQTRFGRFEVKGIY